MNSTTEKTVLKSKNDIDALGIKTSKKVFWNQSTPKLYEHSLIRNEGHLVEGGPIVVYTGKTTGRSPNCRFFVEESSSKDKIWWSDANKPVSEKTFDSLYKKALEHMEDKDLFVRDCYVGSDKKTQLPLRVVTEYAWINLFAKYIFIEPETSELENFKPKFNVIYLPKLKADPKLHGTGSETAIFIHFGKNLILIASSEYGGEMKKAMFTAMNYLLPLKNILTMHCSANIGKKNDTALFFGLSGTGKTTLSADPERGLIGDDEHGWDKDGVFNFEGGCYAKVIRLSPTAEPEIYATTRRFGTIMENVVYDEATGKVDLDDDSVTPNTRACYPLNFIGNAVESKKGPHPKNIIMLTCDAFGVMPPIARLSVNQAMYHFISGYTAKVGGTEIGLKEPKATFSTCFGAPFMVHHPAFYAKLLKENMLNHNVKCWLVNTGWTGGPYGEGERISIKYTRALLNGALSGKLDNVSYIKDPIFGFEIPQECDNVPSDVLNPQNTWKEKEKYMLKYKELAGLFSKNFAGFTEGCTKEIIDAGPIIN
ncbi:MAG TPA: phosphoenolpyruvate carboxykinase (ATP) [Elusimicrobiales bacterium]|nr:phosphoenolpyruvate carboxykinase (ATP) [Elusimicrobiales bacterium]